MRARSFVKIAIAALALVAVLAASAVVALAAHPRRGVNLYGRTSAKGDNVNRVGYVFLQVSSSGKRITHLNVPAACNLTPRPVGGFSISPAGRFSGKRVVRDSGHGSDVKYTIKVAGSFTAPTRAHGTYSLVWTSSSPKGDRSCHSGKQTWKANHVGSSK